MSAWPYVIASYALTLGGAAAIGGWAFLAMRRAEAAVDRLRDR